MNCVNINGIINKFKFDHCAGDTNFYRSAIHMLGKNGAVHAIPVLAPKELTQTGLVNVSGQLRSRNENGYVNIYVLITGKANRRGCALSGTVCKLTDDGFILAINRAYGKTAYITCVYLGRVSIGDHVYVEGWLQSKRRWIKFRVTLLKKENYHDQEKNHRPHLKRR